MLDHLRNMGTLIGHVQIGQRQIVMRFGIGVARSDRLFKLLNRGGVLPLI